MSAYIKKGLSAVRDGGTDALAKAKRAANRTDHPGVADQAEPSTEPVADSAKVAEEAAPGQPTGRARVRRRRAQDEVEDGGEANRASPPVPDAGNAAREEAETTTSARRRARAERRAELETALPVPAPEPEHIESTAEPAQSAASRRAARRAGRATAVEDEAAAAVGGVDAAAAATHGDPADASPTTESPAGGNGASPETPASAVSKRRENRRQRRSEASAQEAEEAEAATGAEAVASTTENAAGEVTAPAIGTGSSSRRLFAPLRRAATSQASSGTGDEPQTAAGAGARTLLSSRRRRSGQPTDTSLSETSTDGASPAGARELPVAIRRPLGKLRTPRVPKTGEEPALAPPAADFEPEAAAEEEDEEEEQPLEPPADSELCAQLAACGLAEDGLAARLREGHISLTVHRTDELPHTSSIAHPLVCVTLVDSRSGRLLRKSVPSRPGVTAHEGETVSRLLPIMTKPFRLAGAGGTRLPAWEEELLIAESYGERTPCPCIHCQHATSPPFTIRCLPLSHRCLLASRSHAAPPLRPPLFRARRLSTARGVDAPCVGLPAPKAAAAGAHCGGRRTRGQRRALCAPQHAAARASLSLAAGRARSSRGLRGVETTQRPGDSRQYSSTLHISLRAAEPPKPLAVQYPFRPMAAHHLEQARHPAAQTAVALTPTRSLEPPAIIPSPTPQGRLTADELRRHAALRYTGSAVSHADDGSGLAALRRFGREPDAPCKVPNTQVHALTAGAAGASAVAFSADGALLAAALADPSGRARLAVYHAASGALLCEARKAARAATALEPEPDPDLTLARARRTRTTSSSTASTGGLPPRKTARPARPPPTARQQSAPG